MPGQAGLLCDEAAEPDFPGWRRCRWLSLTETAQVFCHRRLRSMAVRQQQSKPGASELSPVLFCYDFLDQPVALDETDVDLADVDAARERSSRQPSVRQLP